MAKDSSHLETGGSLWPSPRYHQLVARLRELEGEAIHVSVVAFNGGFHKSGQAYRLLTVASYPAPRPHPHPPKRTYPHMLVLESLQPDGVADAHWQNGRHHGGAVNLAHVGSVTRRAFPESHQDYLYANLDLLATYFGCSPATLLEREDIPASSCVMEGGNEVPLPSPEAVWATGRA